MLVPGRRLRRRGSPRHLAPRAVRGLLGVRRRAGLDSPDLPGVRRSRTPAVLAGLPDRHAPLLQLRGRREDRWTSPAVSAAGEGRRRGSRKLGIRIPAGVETGSRLRAGGRRGCRGRRRSDRRPLRRADGRAARGLPARRGRRRARTRPALSHARPRRRGRRAHARRGGEDHRPARHEGRLGDPPSRAGVRPSRAARPRRLRRPHRRDRPRGPVGKGEGAPAQLTRSSSARPSRAGASSTRRRRSSPSRSGRKV